MNAQMNICSAYPDPDVLLHLQIGKLQSEAHTSHRAVRNFFRTIVPKELKEKWSDGPQQIIT
jgi:hypothetical protein